MKQMLGEKSMGNYKAFKRNTWYSQGGQKVSPKDSLSHVTDWKDWVLQQGRDRQVRETDQCERGWRARGDTGSQGLREVDSSREHRKLRTRGSYVPWCPGGRQALNVVIEI